MHTLKRQDKDQWQVVCLEVGSTGETLYYSLFHSLSFDSAMKLVNFLNGGGAQFSPEMTKVMAMRAS